MQSQDIFAEVNQIVEEMYFDPTRAPYRLVVNKDNAEIIQELKSVCEIQEWLSWSVMGVVGGKKHFILRNRMQVEQGFTAPKVEEKAGELIVVDFRAKKVLSRQAA
jgi:hypothetical protein